MRLCVGLRLGRFEDLPVDGQVSQAYRLLGGMMPQLTAWQAAGKMKAILVEGGDAPSIDLGVYKISLARQARRPGAPAPPAPAPTQDVRLFAIVAETAKDEFV